MSGARSFDVLIVGSGFSGSLLAMSLDHHGLGVCVLEAGQHPRFTIGESSTPAADMVLRSLASDHGMPWLEPFSRYGSWARAHPEVDCGLKRGFAYFHHRPAEDFVESKASGRSLLVAASTSDHDSDTNWYRADVDHHLVERMARTGVTYLDRTRIRQLEWTQGEIWRARLLTAGVGERSVRARYLIDLTGSPRFSEAFLGARSSADGFRTSSSAVFSHFEGVGRWREHLQVHGCSTADHPFDPDHGALHHLVEEGWLWMLRFRSGRVSTGMVFDGAMGAKEHPVPDGGPGLHETIARYPSLRELFREARISHVPGRIERTGRLQRRLDRGWGEGWLSLGHAAGFVDPLHSTGIAHSLVGVERVAEVVRKGGLAALKSAAPMLDAAFARELRLVDRLVATAYDGRSHPGLFEAAVMLYFCCSIAWETDRLSGMRPTHFLRADDDALVEVAEEIGRKVRRWRVDGADLGRADRIVDEVRERIEPWNPLGLLDPARQGMYHHTAVTLGAGSTLSCRLSAQNSFENETNL